MKRTILTVLLLAWASPAQAVIPVIPQPICYSRLIAGPSAPVIYRQPVIILCTADPTVNRERACQRIGQMGKWVRDDLPGVERITWNPLQCV